MGSPFTALLCDSLAARLDGDNRAARAILDWPGDPAPLADGLPLRVAGALHALVRAGEAPGLSAIYPPHPAPTMDELARIVNRTLEAHATRIVEFLRSAPQTNEVGRSAALLAGWLEIAERTDLPLALYEIGSSAGLNLIADRYRYRFADRTWGDASALLEIAPEWTGPPPPVETRLHVHTRRGCDLNPIDLTARAARERLMAYVWPDQVARLARLDAAIETALVDPPRLDRTEAAEWVAEQIPVKPVTGVARILFHSIVWQYLPSTTREEITHHVERVGANATTQAPFAWLRFELAGQESAAELRLRLWPSGDNRLLATGHAHGNWIRWGS